jgi:hypothetical protein
MTATRAEYTAALTLSTDAYQDFTLHLRTCPACRPVRNDCPTRDGLYGTAQRLRKAVDDMVTGWANARRSAAQAATNDDTSTDDQPGG